MRGGSLLHALVVSYSEEGGRKVCPSTPDDEEEEDGEEDKDRHFSSRNSPNVFDSKVSISKEFDRPFLTHNGLLVKLANP